MKVFICFLSLCRLSNKGMSPEEIHALPTANKLNHCLSHILYIE